MKFLTRDTRGRHLSTLVIEDIQLEDSGEYTCQPAAGAPARVLVHVLQRETEVQAVLGEGEKDLWLGNVTKCLSRQLIHFKTPTCF